MMLPLAMIAGLALIAAPTPPAPKVTQLKVEVKPETAILYLDGRRTGTGGKLYTFTVKPGEHHIKILNHGDEHQEVVALSKGEVKKYEWVFEDDRRDRRPVVARPDEKSPPAATPQTKPAAGSVDENEAALSGAFPAAPK